MAQKELGCPMLIHTPIWQKDGNLQRILLSHDVAFKICLTRWGGFGYAHLLENIVPRLLQKGISRQQIDTILIENPKRFLSW